MEKGFSRWKTLSNSNMRFYSLSLLVLSFLYLASSPVLGTESFLKPDKYNKAVVIEEPENNPLAEAFLRNGIKVYSGKPEICFNCFSFKMTKDGSKFIVLVYYRGFELKPEYVGKYVYYKKGKGEVEDFINSFVKWMIENAWATR